MIKHLLVQVIACIIISSLGGHEGHMMRTANQDAATRQTEEIVRKYHASWVAKDFDSAASVLSSALTVETPVNEYPTKESFVAALTAFGRMVKDVTMLGEFARGPD